MALTTHKLVLSRFCSLCKGTHIYIFFNLLKACTTYTKKLFGKLLESIIKQVGNQLTIMLMSWNSFLLILL